MRAEEAEILVDVPVGFNLNEIPERVDRYARQTAPSRVQPALTPRGGGPAQV